MLKLFERCPACGGQIVVTECKCANCNLQMRGEFQIGLFSTLSTDQLTFVQVFLRARGNLTEVEKILGVSYPTIRNKLDEINDTLERAEPTAQVNSDRGENGAAAMPPVEDTRRSILQQVAAGKLSATEAALKLRELTGGK
jgi:hypothetical protein